MARIDLPNGKWLTECEVDVLRIIGSGASSREASGVLCISHRTVDFHFDNIRKKLGTRTRVASLRRMQEFGLLEQVIVP